MRWRALHPALRARLAAFMDTGPALGAPFGEVLKAPVPRRLVDAIMAGGRASAAAPSRSDPMGGIKSLFDNLFSFGRPRWAPAFATVLLAVGAVAGWQLQRVTQEPAAQGQLRVDNGRITARGTLAAALEQARGGYVTTDAASGLAVNVRLTFKSKSQAYCRQYELSGADAAFAGVACRGGDGVWQVQYHVPTAGTANSKGRTVPVGDDKAMLGALIDAMSSSDPLDREEESRARENHWR